MVEAVSQKRSLNALLLSVIAFEILYPLFSVWNLPHSLMVYLRFAVSVLSLLYVLASDYKLVFSKPAVFYTLWAGYVFIRNLLFGYGVWQSPVQMFLGFVPSYITFLVCLYSFPKNEGRLLSYIVAVLYVFVIFGFISGGTHSLTGGIEDEDRLGGELINANALGIRASLIAFCLTALLLRSKISIFVYVSLMVLPGLVILMSGSRTAFIILFFVLMVFVFRKNGKRQSGWIWNVLLLIAGFFAMYYILYNTSMGERLLGSINQAEEYGMYTGTIWDVFGDRGYQYYVSIPVIADHFLLGIGMCNFIDVVPGANMVLHSEYLIQLLECGFIAFVLYFSLYVSITRALLLRRTHGSNETQNTTRLCLFFMIALLFTCFVTRVCYYGMYSCCLAYMAYYGFRKEYK